MHNLTDLEMDALRLLMKDGPARAEDLADRLSRDRSTVYRSLQKLVACQIVAKETKSLARGGYYHVYSPIPKEMLHERLENCIEEWYTRLRDMLDHFDEDMDPG